MSGGVCPPCDISLPTPELQPPVTRSTAHCPTRRSFFTFRQLNALAVVIVLSASGMVSPDDLAFVGLSIFYIFFISKVAFPPTSPGTEPPLFTGKNKLLTLTVVVGALIGLYLPIAYIFEGILEGDREGIKAAAPHVFMLASQVFMEGVANSAGLSLPVRAFVPVFYNSMRIMSIMGWLRSEMSKVEMGFRGGGRRLFVGKVLAVANMAFWSFNLFGFLLPFYLPKALKMYYTDNKAKD